MNFRFLLATALVIGLFLFNLVFIFLGIYNHFLNADDVFHFLGGIFMAFFLMEFFLFTFKSKKSFKHHLMMTLLIFTSTVTVAVFWEVAEFLAGPLLGIVLQQNLRDTMQDLILGSAGAGIVASFYFFLMV